MGASSPFLFKPEFPDTGFPFGKALAARDRGSFCMLCGHPTLTAHYTLKDEKHTYIICDTCGGDCLGNSVAS